MKTYEPMEAEVRRFLRLGIENLIEKLTDIDAEELMQVDDGQEEENREPEELAEVAIEIEPLDESLRIAEDPNLLKERQLQSIAQLIVQEETRSDGCAAFIQYARKEKILDVDLRSVDVDLDQVAEKLAKEAKEYCLRRVFLENN